MKYSDSNPPRQCFINQSNWLKGAIKNGKPVGILWHDTAAGNPNIARYVQPDDNLSNRQEIIDWLGVNYYANDWNHIDRDAGVHFFVGKIADGSITSVQIGPWTTHAWGCGGGYKGSCNGYVNTSNGSYWVDPFWIQFEICDDNYQSGKNSKEYFLAVYQEACEMTAYLCKKFGIDPKGNVEFNGVTVPTILCHQDSYQLGLGGNHSDVYEWFKIYGYTMDKVREDVAKIINESNTQSAPVTQPSDVVVELYRVRKSWEDKKSQVGAYTNLAVAIKACDNAGYGYSVFDSTGKETYTAPAPVVEDDPEPDDKIEQPVDENTTVSYGTDDDDRPQTTNTSTSVEPEPTESTEPIITPIEDSVELTPSVNEPTSEPADEPTNNPIDEPTDTPINELTDELTDAPINEPTESIIDPTKPTEKEVNWMIRLIRAFVEALNRLFTTKDD